MAKLAGGRPDFREWVDKKPDPKWGLMPLTHITKGISANDIFRAGAIETSTCDVFKENLAYLFYGRPAYRVSGDGSIRTEAACPFCFIFNANVIHRARSIFAFDTGAFDKRLYSRILVDEIEVEDFNLETEIARPNKLIHATFGSKYDYFQGDISKIDPNQPDVWEYHARAYLHLIASPGRNEPDDRVCSIEVVFGNPIEIDGNLKAVVVPHSIWTEGSRAPWLQDLQKNGVTISPYLFVPGKHPEYYQALLEAEVRSIYDGWGVL